MPEDSAAGNRRRRAGQPPEARPSPARALPAHPGLRRAGHGRRLSLSVVCIGLALVLIAAGVYVARGRRRALVGAGLGLAASMLILLPLLLVYGIAQRAFIRGIAVTGLGG